MATGLELERFALNLTQLLPLGYSVHIFNVSGSLNHGVNNTSYIVALA
jgi:hypothetical protein